MHDSTHLDPERASAEIDRIHDKVRRARWWHVTAALFTACFTGACFVAMTVSPDGMADYVLPGLVAYCALMGLMAWRQRAKDPAARRLEEPAVWASLAATVIAVAAKAVFDVGGLTPAAVVIGILPAIPFAVLAWRVARR